MKLNEVEITDEVIEKLANKELTIKFPKPVVDDWELTNDSTHEEVAEKLKTLDKTKYAMVERNGRLIVMDRGSLTRINARAANPSGHISERGTRSVLHFKDEIVATFPEIAELFNDVDQKIASGSCKGCVARREINRIVTALVDLALQFPEREMSDELTATLGPVFSRHVARRRYNLEDGTLAVPTKTGVYKLQPVTKHEHAVGVRPSCLNCIRKHLGQAIILFQESELSEYANHFWLGIGHIAEAESEALSSYPKFAEQLRNLRLMMMEDRDYVPNLSELFDDIDMLEDNQLEPSGRE